MTMSEFLVTSAQKKICNRDENACCPIGTFAENLDTCRVPLTTDIATDCTAGTVVDIGLDGCTDFAGPLCTSGTEICCETGSPDNNICAAPYQTNDAGTAKTLCLFLRAVECGPNPSPTPIPIPNPAPTVEKLDCWTDTGASNLQNGYVVDISGGDSAEINERCEALCDSFVPTPEPASHCMLALDYE